MERRIPPLRTELEYKPVDVDRLSAILGGLSCQTTEGCRIQNCFTDREHLISSNPSRGVAPLTEVEQMLKSHPDFIIPSICRWKHERINATWDRSEPISDDFGVGYLLASPLNLGANQRRRLKDLRRQLGGSSARMVG